MVAPADLLAASVELAATHWRAAESDAERAGLSPPLAGTRHDQLLARLTAELRAPLDLEAWPAPTAPRPVAGGWIHDEVLDDDRAAFEAMVADRAGGNPEEVAHACQELRLPVTPYRALPPANGGRPGTPGPARPATVARRHRARPGPVRIVDLSTHWAGPLATTLLAEAGAEVVKVDPDCRPDGFRDRPALYRHLNRRKEVVDLDLRRGEDRARFEALLAGADLLVESFSRRVLDNLGYHGSALARLNPRLAVLSIKAFPAGSAEAGWLAYGPGVHAASGLGLVTGRPVPATIAYPDLVAGVVAYARATTLLADQAAGQPRSVADRVEVSLAGSIAPLVRGVAPRVRGVAPRVSSDIGAGTTDADG